jgi:transcriptional regulator
MDVQLVSPTHGSPTLFGRQIPIRWRHRLLELTVTVVYLPDHFRVEDVTEMRALMRARPFAALISAGAAGLYASHLPTVLKEDGRAIECHLALANPHWRDLAECDEALMIFQGPEAYITPNWYPSKVQHGKAVPTWNFAVVHAYGCPEVIKDKDWLLRHVTQLTAQQERNEVKPWRPSDAPGAYIEAMLRGIVGIRFAVRRLEGKYKMSQNRETQDQVGIVQGLNARAAVDDSEVAAMVSRQIKSITPQP